MLLNLNQQHCRRGERAEHSIGLSRGSGCDMFQNTETKENDPLRFIMVNKSQGKVLVLFLVKWFHQIDFSFPSHHSKIVSNKSQINFSLQFIGNSKMPFTVESVGLLNLVAAVTFSLNENMPCFTYFFL